MSQKIGEKRIEEDTQCGPLAYTSTNTHACTCAHTNRKPTDTQNTHTHNTYNKINNKPNYWLSILAHACNPSTWEGGKSHPWLHSEFEGSLVI